MRYALDESILAAELPALDAALADDMCAGLVLKPTLLGGIERTLTLAALAAKHGKPAVLTAWPKDPS